ncbi:hypothetical protein [Chondromyces crocatus]|uniref:hypothetical protein n=1 Tax=Chondromyces crocatus TaxID=52 RepID=UPI001FDF3A95|nr:hypothetical protein [Chondromyces crocatus]
MRCNLDRYLREPGISEGQRRRLQLFQTVESGVCAKVERFCTEHGIEVTDLAVLLVAPEAHLLFRNALLAQPGSGRRPSTPQASLILGHRSQLHSFLRRALPPNESDAADPYMDLMTPAPARCVRILIIDDDSLTIMSYGTFVTVSMNLAEMPDA